MMIMITITTTTIIFCHGNVREYNFFLSTVEYIKFKNNMIKM